jgi:hypothetical protein
MALIDVGANGGLIGLSRGIVAFVGVWVEVGGWMGIMIIISNRVEYQQRRRALTTSGT